MAQRPVLNLIKDGEVIKTYTLEGEAVLGRASGSDIRVDDRAISRQHAVFRVVGNNVQVEKRSEFAPLVINGAECTSAVLKSGDMVAAGPYLIKIEVPPETVEKPVEKPVEPNKSEGVAASTAPVPERSRSVPDLDAPADGVPGLEGALSETPPSDGPKDSPVDQAAGGLPGLDLDVNASPNEIDAPKVDSAPLEAPVDTGAAAPDLAIDEDAKTKFTSVSNVSIRLIFKPGEANVTEYELTKDVIYLGRGQDCDIVLNDKKSSRKNSMIRKSGLNFIIKDLESANGTFVNGIKIQEQELSGEDVVKIGNVEFVFKAVSSDYASQEKDFMALPAEEEVIAEASPNMPGMGDMGIPADPLAGQAAVDVSGAGAAGPIPGIGDGSIPGITGVGTGASGKKLTLMEKFRALPKRTQLIAAAAGGLFAWWLMEEDELPIVPKKAVVKKVAPSPSPMADKGPLTFELLSPEQKKFVEAQHALAFDYYKNKDYDKALFEIQKIFTLVNDFKDAREIERYAKEGKKKLEAFEEERRRKEEEAKLKAQIAQLVEECRQRMAKKQYEQAKELFVQIIGLDPDNADVTNWRKQIDAYEEDLKMKEQQKQVEAEINKHGWELFKQAEEIRKQQKYQEAIKVYQKAIDIGVSDKTLAPKAKAMIALCTQSIARKRNPVLREAKRLESAGEYPQAFKTFKKATIIDPAHPEGYAGMNRIRGILHDRAKVAYTEAILAESYSDFATAKKMYEECFNVAPPGDIYKERSQRKLARYFKKKEDGL